MKTEMQKTRLYREARELLLRAERLILAARKKHEISFSKKKAA